MNDRAVWRAMIMITNAGNRRGTWKKWKTQKVQMCCNVETLTFILHTCYLFKSCKYVCSWTDTEIISDFSMQYE